MKAMLSERYGAFPELQEIPTPSPKDDEVLVRVHATTVSSGDWRARTLVMPPGFGIFARLAFGFLRPRQPILGTELSGRVEAIGKAVTRFRVGDEVLAFTGAKMGCHVEYKCLREDGPIVHKPKNLSFDQAAALSFGGTTALSVLRRGDVGKGDRVLVNGASGAVGSACVQLAKHFGATVTGVCSGSNTELVRSLGADEVIDYTREDFTLRGPVFDVVIDTAGTAPYARSKAALVPGGRMLIVLGSFLALFSPLFVRKHRIFGGPTSGSREDLQTLVEIAERGGFTPAIDRVYPFNAMALAHEQVAAGHKRGSVVVSVAHHFSSLTSSSSISNSSTALGGMSGGEPSLP